MPLCISAVQRRFFSSAPLDCYAPHSASCRVLLLTGLRDAIYSPLRSPYTTTYTTGCELQKNWTTAGGTRSIIFMISRVFFHTYRWNPIHQKLARIFWMWKMSLIIGNKFSQKHHLSNIWGIRLLSWNDIFRKSTWSVRFWRKRHLSKFLEILLKIDR